MIQDESEDSTRPLLAADAYMLNLSSVQARRLPTINPDETKRIADVIQNALGYLEKLGAKLPKPVIALGLLVASIVPIILDITLQPGDVTLAQMFSKTQSSSLIWCVYTGLGFLSLYNGAGLSREAKLATEQPSACSKLTVQQTPSATMQRMYEENVLLNAQMILAKNDREALLSRLEARESLLSELLGQPFSETAIAARRQTAIREFSATTSGSAYPVGTFRLFNPVSAGSVRTEPSLQIVASRVGELSAAGAFETSSPVVQDSTRTSAAAASR